MYNILSLDGGGSWSILQLLTLKEKYGNKNGHEILREYDMVIANSGGSIILAALAENWQLDKTLELFKNEEIRKTIFSKNKFRERFFPVDYTGRFFGPKYSAKRKGEAFRTIFAEVNKYEMSELPAFIGKPSLKLAVCTYDALNNKAKFFKSYHNNPFYEFDSVRLTQAIHGSSNAPVLYFDFPARFKAKGSEIFYELWDGALGGFNNPVVAGIIEALNCGVALNEIKIISLGTGNKTMAMQDKENFYRLKQISIKERFNKWKLWRLKFQLQFFKATILNQAKTILYQPPDWANYVAHMFLKQGNVQDVTKNFVRLSPMIHSDKQTEAATAQLLQQLYALDMDLTTPAEIALLENCFTHWKNGAIKNQPVKYHINRENELVYLEGHKTFSEAFNNW